MAEEFLPLGSAAYFLLLGVLLFARGMDFLSTWVGTPSLALEANPIARKLGWRMSLIVQPLFCLALALWPLPAIALITMSLLIAARNFQSAWLMRTMGEHMYRVWMVERFHAAPRMLFFSCLFAQFALVALLGLALIYFSQLQLVPFGIGVGLVGYGLAILLYSSLSVWRFRSRPL